jgi:2,4-dienoyl-CoA reductase-like NADH-dependent reductase (Old Yellow Enzyme family)/thioredoxin reductase
MKTQTTPYERLFSPLKVGPIHVANRICETTNTIGAARTMGTLDDAFTAHHLAKAQGGTAWIGHETWLLNSPLPPHAAMEFHPGSGTIPVPIYLMPGFVESVAKFVDAIHEAGAVVVCQLTHLNNTMAASSVPLVEAYDWIPHELDDDEIEKILDTYAAAALKFQEAGADGIEIHCAHETTPQTFLSPAMNKRKDKWGGGAEERARFVCEALTRTKQAIGDTMALGIRINGQESREGGYDLLEMRQMMKHIAATGALDFVNVDVGHSWGRPAYVQPSYYGHAVYREVGKALKVDLPGVAILFSGRVNDPGIAEQLLVEECCDLVGMTRAGIADPEFANKAREGRLLELRRCIGCNRCIGQSIRNDAPDAFKSPICSVNPEIGNELTWKLTYKSTDAPKRVVVVGGGAAGLEAARVSAMRGHDVTLLERSPALGGQVRLAMQAPGRDSYEDFIIYEDNQMKLHEVDVRLGVEASVADVLALKPDAVVVATGSLPRIPDTPGIELPHVVQGWDVLAKKVEVGERVAVVSQEDHFETGNIAHLLAENGRQVEIFHKWTAIGAQIDRYSIGPIMQGLAEHGVVIHTGMRLASVKPEQLEFFSSFGGPSQCFEGFDSVVLVYGSVPDSRLYRELRDEGSIAETYLVGSAWVPRLLAESVQHGARVGLAI